MDHIRLRIPKESGGEAGRALPILTDVRAFMGEKKAMDVQASPLVRPVEVTGPTSGEIVLADVNQPSDVRAPT